MEAPVMFSAEWWQQPLGSWMAWNRVTIAFFLYVFGSILAMGVWEYFSPSSASRRWALVGSPLEEDLPRADFWALVYCR